MTDAQFDEIQARTQNVRIYRDRFGGEYVLNKDGRIFGAHACLDRQKLMAYIEELHNRLSALGLRPFTLTPYQE